jgi:hypothetical protein
LSSAIIRNGRWRRRDPLKGLSLTMLEALETCQRGGALIGAGVTARALAERGLIIRSAGPDGARPGFRVTRDGAEVLGELARRRAVRARLIAEKPSRRISP